MRNRNNDLEQIQPLDVSVIEK